MKKIIAAFGIAALAACGGDDADTAVIEDTTVVAPAVEPAPVTTDPMVTDTTMMTTDPAMPGTDTMTTDTAGTTGM